MAEESSLRGLVAALPEDHPARSDYEELTLALRGTQGLLHATQTLLSRLVSKEAGAEDVLAAVIANLDNRGQREIQARAKAAIAKSKRD